MTKTKTKAFERALQVGGGAQRLGISTEQHRQMMREFCLALADPSGAGLAQAQALAGVLQVGGENVVGWRRQLARAIEAREALRDTTFPEAEADEAEALAKLNAWDNETQQLVSKRAAGRAKLIGAHVGAKAKREKAHRAQAAVEQAEASKFVAAAMELKGMKR